MHPAHFPEPLELRSCGEHNGLNYSVWTSRAGPGRQELTSPHLLHACDPRFSWELVGAFGRASGLPRLALTVMIQKGNPTSAREGWVTLRAPSGRCPLLPAARKAGEHSKSPQVPPACCEASRRLCPGMTEGPRCHRRALARRDASQPAPLLNTRHPPAPRS